MGGWCDPYFYSSLIMTIHIALRAKATCWGKFFPAKRFVCGSIIGTLTNSTKFGSSQILVHLCFKV